MQIKQCLFDLYSEIGTFRNNQLKPSLLEEKWISSWKFKRNIWKSFDKSQLEIGVVQS